MWPPGLLPLRSQISDLTPSPTASGLSSHAHPHPAHRSTHLQLSNLYLLFALNEALVLRSTASVRTWSVLLFCLLVADLGHLSTMIPLALERGWAEVFGRFWTWGAMMRGSVRRRRRLPDGTWSCVWSWW